MNKFLYYVILLLLFLKINPTCSFSAMNIYANRHIKNVCDYEIRNCKNILSWSKGTKRLPDGGKFVLYHAHYTAGLGNRIMGLASVIAYGLATERSILVNWPTIKSKFFHPNGEIMFMPGIYTFLKRHETINWDVETKKNSYFFPDVLSYDRSKVVYSGENYHLHVNEEDSESFKTFLSSCVDVGIIAKRKQVTMMMIQTTSWWGEILFSNPIYVSRLRRYFHSVEDMKENLFQFISNIFFTPSLRSQNILNSILHNIDKRSSYIVSIHARSPQNVKLNSMDHIQKFMSLRQMYISLSCAKAAIQKLTSTHDGRGKTIYIFIASDSDVFKAMARQYLNTYMFLDMSSVKWNMEGNKLIGRGSLEGVLKGWVEVLLLAQSSYFVMWPKSTFSILAASMIRKSVVIIPANNICKETNGPFPYVEYRSMTNRFMQSQNIKAVVPIQHSILRLKEPRNRFKSNIYIVLKHCGPHSTFLLNTIVTIEERFIPNIFDIKWIVIIDKDSDFSDEKFNINGRFDMKIYRIVEKCSSRFHLKALKYTMNQLKKVKENNNEQNKLQVAIFPTSSLLIKVIKINMLIDKMASYSGVIAFGSATTNFRRKKMDQTINFGIEVLNNCFFFGNINAFNVLIAVMARFMGKTEMKNTSRAESISHVLKAAGINVLPSLYIAKSNFEAPILQNALLSGIASGDKDDASIYKDTNILQIKFPETYFQWINIVIILVCTITLYYVLSIYIMYKGRKQGKKL